MACAEVTPIEIKKWVFFIMVIALIAPAFYFFFVRSLYYYIIGGCLMVLVLVGFLAVVLKNKTMLMAYLALALLATVLCAVGVVVFAIETEKNDDWETLLGPSIVGVVYFVFISLITSSFS